MVDSVTRQWVEKARQNGQDLAAASNTPAGTYAAGVHRMSEVLPMMMNETIQVAPENQKVRFQVAKTCLLDALVLSRANVACIAAFADRPVIVR